MSEPICGDTFTYGYDIGGVSKVADRASWSFHTEPQTFTCALPKGHTYDHLSADGGARWDQGKSDQKGM